MFKKIESKKGISVIVGYVLLVVIALSMSLLVYSWLKSYIPKENPECPSTLSIIIEDYSCPGNDKLVLTLKNTGFFNIDGFVAKVSNETGALPTKPLKKLEPEGRLVGSDGQFLFVNALKPDDKTTHTFTYTKYKKILEIEIIPFRKIEKKQRLCDNAKIKKKLEGCN